LSVPGETQPRRRKRRWWKWLLIVPAALVALVIGLVLAVLWIPAASRLAIEQGLSRWSASIPARVEWRTIEGSIGRGLSIDGLAVYDGDDQPLVRVERLELDLRLRALVRRTAEVERLELTGAEVWLDHEWGDLADPDAPERPPEPGYGPDLPLTIVATIELHDGRVWREDVEFAVIETLAIEAWGEGRQATATLALAAVELFERELRVDALELVARWDSPVATLERLELRSPLGEIEELVGVYDVERETGELALVIEGQAEALAEQFELEQLRAADRARLELVAEGGPGGLTATLGLDLGGAGELGVELAGVPTGPTGERWARADIRGRLGAGVLADPARQGPLSVELGASIRGRPHRPGFIAELDGHLDDQRSGERIELDLDATSAAVDPLIGRARVELRGAGVELEATLDRPKADSLTGAWSLRSAALSRPLAIAAGLLDAPELAELRGSLVTTGRCFTAEPGDLRSLRCPLELGLAEASGWGIALGLAELEGWVEPLADPLALVAKLELQDLRLPDDAFVFDELAVAARGSLARLELEAAGHGEREEFALAGAVELGDARVVVELDRLGLISARGDGPAAVRLLAPTRVVIEDQAVDIDGLSLAAVGGRIDIDGRLDLDQARARSDLRVEIDAVELDQIAALIPELAIPTIDGALSIHGALQGSLSDPDAWVRVQGRRLRVADYWLGTLELVAIYGQAPPGVAEPRGAQDIEAGVFRLALDQDLRAFEADDLRVWAYSAGPMAARIDLAASLPLRFVGGPRLAPGEPMAVRVAVERFNLTALGGLMPETPGWWRQVPADAAAPPGDPKLIPEGRLDLDLAVAGTPEQPRIASAIRVRELVVDRAQLGSVLVRARYDHQGDLQGAGLELDYKSGFAQVELRGHLPATLDLARGQADWSPATYDHLVSLDLRALDLRALRATLGPKLPALDERLAELELDGLLSLSVRGAGSIEAPELQLALRGLGLRHRDHELGQLRLLASYIPGRAEAEVYLDGPIARRLDARVSAPIEFEFGADDPLRVDLDAPITAELQLIDLSVPLLERQLGPLPVRGEPSLVLELRGTLAEPAAELSARVEGIALNGDPLGDVRLSAALERGRLAIDADLFRPGEHRPGDHRPGEQLFVTSVEVPLILAISPTLTDSEIGWDREGAHRILLSASRIDDQLVTALLGRGIGPPRLVPIDDGRESSLAVSIVGGGRLSEFRVSGELAGQIIVDDELDLDVHADFALDQAKQRLHLALHPSIGEGLSADLELAGPVPALVRGEQALGEIGFGAEFAAPNFDLACISGLLPPGFVDARGILRADFSGSGLLAAPLLRGSLELEDVAVTIIALRQRLRDINLDFDFAGEQLTLRDLSIQAGRGSLTGRGEARVSSGTGLDADLHFAITDFPLIRPGLPAIALDTSVDIDLRRRAGATDVEVTLLGTEVTVAGVSVATTKPVPRSDDITFVRGTGPIPRPPDPAEPDPVVDTGGRFALTIDLSDPLLITGAAIDMAWFGTLELVVEAGEVDVGGRLEASRGRLRLLGNTFELRRGIVTLPDDGSLDPYLDIEAVAATAEAEVTVTVRGRVSRPALEFSSTPPLTEYQILTLLITGSTELGANDAEVSARAASLLAAVSNPQLQAQLNRHLGIDRAELGFGDAIDQPILTIGKRITRDLYVETTYRHNAPDDQNTAEVAIEYSLRRHWTAETFFGDAAVGGLGLYWTRSFAAPAWGRALRSKPLERR